MVFGLPYPVIKIQHQVSCVSDEVLSTKPGIQSCMHDYPLLRLVLVGCQKLEKKEGLITSIASNTASFFANIFMIL